MSDPLSMNGTDPVGRWETQLAAVARALPYPATPNVAAVLATPRDAQPLGQRPVGAVRPAARGATPRRVGRPALAWALAVLVLATSLLAVPAVRASLVTVFQLGVVRVILGPTATETATLTPAPTATGTRRPPTATPPPTATALSSVLDLAGQTTLADAIERVRLPIRLPTYPADLGEPDLVFVQDLDGQAVVLVWLTPDDPSQVRLSLHLLTSSQLVDKQLKVHPAAFEFTLVNDHEAFWTTGPYYIVNRRGDYAEMRLISGHVLIWYEDEVTYRLETSLPLEEARRIAESLE
jgi:hypothetical protein